MKLTKWPSVYLKLTELYLERKDLKGAEDAVAEGLERNPESTLVRIAKGRLLRAQGHDQEAIKVLREVTRDDPGNATPYLEIARICRDQEGEIAENELVRHCTIVLETAWLDWWYPTWEEIPKEWRVKGIEPRMRAALSMLHARLVGAKDD